MAKRPPHGVQVGGGISPVFPVKPVKAIKPVKTTAPKSAYGSGMPKPPVSPSFPGGPLSIADTSGQARAITEAQLQAAADIINRRSRAGSQAISSLTNYWKGQLGRLPGEVTDAYKPAKLAAETVANYSGQSLTQAGADTQAGLNTSLGQAGVQGPGDVNLPVQGVGAGTAVQGMGLAELQRLIASEAATQARTALEPSFAAMTGEQNQQMLAAQLARQLADMQSNIEGQLPSVYMQLQNQAYGQAVDQRNFQYQQAQDTYSKQVDAYNRQWQQYTYGQQKAQQRAAIVAPNAPTLGGRKSYWDQQAEKRTQDTGYRWVGTTSGMRPFDADPHKPGIQRELTLQGQAASTVLPQKVDVTLSRAAGTWVDSSGQPVANPPAKPPPPYYKPKTKTPVKVDVTLSRAAGAWLDSSGNPVPGVPGKPPPLYKPKTKTPIKVNVTLSKAAGTWVDSSGNPVKAPGLPPKPPASSTGARGTAPRRVGPGKWVTAKGKPLGSAAARVWEKKFQGGFTDGKGHLTPGKPKKTGAGGFNPAAGAYG